MDDCAVETEDVTGDHGLEEAIELRERLRLYGDAPLVAEELSSICLTTALETRRCEVPFTVLVFSSTSTRVELFQAGRLLFTVPFIANLDGDDSGVRL